MSKLCNSSSMKVIYACDFDLSKRSGKDRATKDKLKALTKQVSELRVLHQGGKSKYIRLLMLPFFEMKIIWEVLSFKPDMFISRGNCGFFAQVIARLMGIKTVREIHADAIGEAKLLKFNFFQKNIIKLMALICNKIDCMANVRIFNHPDLMAWFRRERFDCEHDFYCYNGYAKDAACLLSMVQAREKLGLLENRFYLAFVGGASEWHGVDYLVALQKEFLKNGDNIQIVVGGGDITKIDPSNVCLNITPLDPNGCAELIVASDLCLLPVKNNRVSPGSPLKLYDYIANKKLVVAQENTRGYSDEVLRYNVGIEVDFCDPIKSRNKILDLLENSCGNQEPYAETDTSWEHRMRFWLSKIIF